MRPGFLLGTTLMIKRGKILFGLLLFFSILSFGQDASYKVIVNQGNNKIDRNGDPINLKIGLTLSSTDKIILQKDSYVALLSTFGETIELKGSQKLEINLSELSGTNQKSDIISKYAAFVFDKMSPDEVEKNRKAYASVTGAVQRAVGVTAYMNKKSHLYESFAIVRWDPGSGEAPYRIQLNDAFGNLLYTEETTNNYFKIDFMQNGLSDVDIVIITFVDAQAIKSSYSISKSDAAAADESFSNEILQLKSYLDDNSAFQNLILAEFFEQNGYILDASTCFEKARILEPEVTYFNDAYREFLMRNKFGDRLD